MYIEVINFLVLASSLVRVCLLWKLQVRSSFQVHILAEVNWLLVKKNPSLTFGFSDKEEFKVYTNFFYFSPK